MKWGGARMLALESSPCAWAGGKAPLASSSVPIDRARRMSHIVLVRHAQASFLERDYDKLCANGEIQANLLGEYWARHGLAFTSAYSGPALRQRETARIVREAYGRAGIEFPETVVMNEFDEYQAEAVLRECLPQLLQVNAEIRELRHAYEKSLEGSDSANPRNSKPDDRA